ncbi:LysR family transcriptional regulator [Clostridium boliviensis]|uniref:LysR family transcriptional regulator n=1 Tax=Clostridium boliviensis TaxID=318465 RepID=UPI00301480F0
MSRFINNLEHQLGCKLFVRSNRGISLTPEGEKLYSHVKIAQEQFRAAEVPKSSLKEPIPRRSICLVENTSRCPSIAANALKQMKLSRIPAADSYNNYNKKRHFQNIS